MRLGFPFWRLIRDPRDLFSYFVVRCMGSPKLVTITWLAEGIKKSFPYLLVHPPILNGKCVVLTTGDNSEIEIFREFFMDRVVDLEVVPFEPDYVVDCGAHTGMFTLLASMYFPNSAFTLFEPNRKNLDILKKMLAINRLKVSLYPAAVSTKDGTAFFVSNMSYDGHIVEKTDGSSIDTVEVKCVDLKKYIRENLQGNLLLKLDIEGHEIDVIPDIIGSLPTCTAIFFETHNGEHAWRQISDVLRSEGFEVHQTRWREPFADGYAVRIH